MIYELWEIVTDNNYSEPFLLIEKNSNFSEIYKSYTHVIKTKPCAIFINLENK